VAAGLLLTACGSASPDGSAADPAASGSGSGTASTGADAGSGAGSEAGAAGDGGAGDGGEVAEALRFSGTTIEGADWRGADLAGKPVILWFWAPWCTICRSEAPGIAEVAADLEGQVAIVGVSGRGEVPAMKQFVDDTGTGALTHLADVDGSIWSRFGVVSQPTFVLVSPDGTTEGFSGALGEDALRERAEALAGA
jgi:thiol-disulfide isomerase/thioredoxin